MSAMIEQSDLPDSNTVSRAAAALLLGNSPSYIGTCIREKKIVPKEDGTITIGELRRFHATRGRKAGKTKQEGRIYHVRLTDEQVEALRSADPPIEVVDPRQAQRDRDARNLEEAKAEVELLQKEVAAAEKAVRAGRG